MLGTGRILMILGVAVWPVWGALYLAGRAPHLLVALVLHLALIVPGAALVRRARDPGGGSPLRTAGLALLIFGIVAWLPYFWLQEISGRSVSSLPFLIWHLAGVVPGALLRYTPLGAR